MVLPKHERAPILPNHNEKVTRNSEHQLNKTYIQSVNPFVPNASFLYPLKTLENHKVF